MSTPVDEIKSRLDIIDVVNEYIQLKKAGTNWKALCPFHSEKTPSFMVSREKQIWHCFGCDEGGDIFEFIKKIENIEFPEALKILAKKAGVELRHIDPQMQNKKTKLMDICNAAANFYHHFLLEDTEAKRAREYLKRRGLEDSTIEDFKIGYAPPTWDRVLQFLRNKHYFDNDILDSGLVIKKEQGSGYYDRFRNRIMFPIANTHGDVVGFTGRLLGDDSSQSQQGGKYVNTPSTLIYDKSKVIYGFDKARSEIKKQNLAILVEGQMDVVSSHQAGVKNVIAASGTSLTDDQLMLIRRYSTNIAMAYDMDEAGRAASERAVEAALLQGMNVKIISIPGGKDPDECIRTNPKEWIKAIDLAERVMEYYFRTVFDKYETSNIESKKRIVDILLAKIGKLQNKVEQSHYIKLLADKLSLDEAILWETFSHSAKNRRYRSQEQAKQTPSKEKQFNRPVIEDQKNKILAQRILALCLKFPENLSYVIGELPAVMIEYPQLKKLYKDLIIYYTKRESKYTKDQKKSISIDDFLHTLDKEYQKYYNQLLFIIDKDFFELTYNDVREELIRSINLLKRDYLTKKLQEIQRDIEKSEQLGQEEDIDRKIQEFKMVSDQLSEIEL